MMFCATITLLCAGSVSVVLPPSATSTGLEISVSEIAEVKGLDPDTVALVGAASLGYAPAPGYHRTLRADLVQASLRQALPGVDITVTGAPRCRIAPATVVIGGDRIRAEAAKSLRQAMLGLDAEARPEGALPNVEIPASDDPPTIRVELERGRIFPGLRSVPVQIWVGSKLYRTVHVTFRVSVWRRQAVLKRAVNVGEPLHAGLFHEKRMPVGDAAGLQSLQVYELGGAIALKPLAAGTVVSERDVHREVVVHRGELVSVRIIRGSITVSDVGMASADGRVGERVIVVMKSTGRELQAVVRGAKTLEVKIQ